MKTPAIQLIYDALMTRWGEQQWWPAESGLEMMLGAILTQNTAWTNVEKAIANLKKANVLDFESLENATIEQIAGWIRPAGYYNQKAKYIQTMIKTIRNRFDGSIEKLFELQTISLRKELLSWRGIGPETADSILLYAARRPVFVVDAYTRRFLIRHGWCSEKTSYDEVAKIFTDQLPADVKLCNEYHALIVKLAKEHCRVKPICDGCPLESFL